MSAKKIAACAKICDLRRAVISQEPLIRFLSNFSRCLKYLVLCFELGYFILKSNCLQNYFFSEIFIIFHAKIGSVIKKKKNLCLYPSSKHSIIVFWPCVKIWGQSDKRLLRNHHAARKKSAKNMKLRKSRKRAKT